VWIFVKRQSTFFVWCQFLLGTQPRAEEAACHVFCTTRRWASWVIFNIILFRLATLLGM
jgi:hypothetical protein